MIEWEYKVFDLVDDDAEKEQAVLNTQGACGWKVMAVVMVGSVRRRFYLKRRLSRLAKEFGLSG